MAYFNLSLSKFDGNFRDARVKIASNIPSYHHLNDLKTVYI